MRVENLRTYQPKPGERAVRIDRRTQLGNPYRITKARTRGMAIAEHRQMLKNNPLLQKHARQSLAGADVLLCWCAPEPCHGQNYVDLLEGTLD